MSGTRDDLWVCSAEGASHHISLIFDRKKDKWFSRLTGFLFVLSLILDFCQFLGYLGLLALNAMMFECFLLQFCLLKPI